MSEESDSVTASNPFYILVREVFTCVVGGGEGGGEYRLGVFSLHLGGITLENVYLIVVSKYLCGLWFPRGISFFLSVEPGPVIGRSRETCYGTIIGRAS